MPDCPYAVVILTYLILNLISTFEAEVCAFIWLIQPRKQSYVPVVGWSHVDSKTKPYICRILLHSICSDGFLEVSMYDHTHQYAHWKNSSLSIFGGISYETKYLGNLCQALPWLAALSVYTARNLKKWLADMVLFSVALSVQAIAEVLMLLRVWALYEYSKQSECSSFHDLFTRWPRMFSACFSWSHFARWDFSAPLSLLTNSWFFWSRNRCSSMGYSDIHLICELNPMATRKHTHSWVPFKCAQDCAYYTYHLVSTVLSSRHPVTHLHPSAYNVFAAGMLLTVYFSCISKHADYRCYISVYAQSMLSSKSNRATSPRFMARYSRNTDSMADRARSDSWWRDLLSHVRTRTTYRIPL
jgi:hypothetical protein